MGPIWGRQDPGGPHVGPMNFALWVHFLENVKSTIFNIPYMLFVINQISKSYLLMV